MAEKYTFLEQHTINFICDYVLPTPVMGRYPVKLGLVIQLHGSLTGRFERWRIVEIDQRVVYVVPASDRAYAANKLADALAAARDGREADVAKPLLDLATMVQGEKTRIGRVVDRGGAVATALQKLGLI